MPEISVIMGVYNQFNKDILEAAVNSILSQSFRDFEFIIYDDGSHPEAAEILKEVAKTDPRIKLIGREENHGLAFSLNSCIRIAKGRYIARMDADDISYPERFAKQRDFLEKNTEYSWVGCNIEVFDEKGIWGRRNMPERPVPEDYLKFSPYAHPTVMYRASIFDKNEGYVDSEDMLRCEDYEIFMRLKSQGLCGANLQEYLFAYRECDDSYKRRSFRFRINEAKCRYRNFKKLGILFPKGWLYVFRPVFACLIPGKILKLIKHIQSGRLENRKTIEVESYEKKNSIDIVNSHIIGNVSRVRVG